MKNEKTNKRYWEKSWGESKLWTYKKIVNYMATRRRMDNLFKSFLEQDCKKTIWNPGGSLDNFESWKVIRPKTAAKIDRSVFSD